MPIGASGVALTGAGLSAAGGLSSAFGASNAYNAQQSALSNAIATASANPAGIFGSTPQYNPVDYQPLYTSDPGYAGIANDVLKGDLYNLKPATDLTSQINAATSSDAMKRITGWDPSFMSSLNLLTNNANSALLGNLPFQDVQSIAGTRAQAQNILGNAGGSGPLTAADLGQTRESLMTQVGPSLLSQVTGILNQVDPVSNQVNASNFLLSPSQGVQSAVGENEFGANFNMQQNLQEAAFGAMPNPQDQGLFNLQLLQAGLSGQQNTGLSTGLSTLGSLFSNPATQYGLTGSTFNPYGSLFGSSNSLGLSPYGNTSFVGSGGYVPHSISQKPYGF